MAKSTDLKALRGLIKQVHLIVSTTPVAMPEGRTERASELLDAALKLADDLIATPPAVAMGSKGGKATLAARGPDYFRQLALRRKTRAGGRPKKDPKK